VARIEGSDPTAPTLMSALKVYRLDNGVYPTTEQGLNALIAKPTTEPIPPNWRQGGYIERNAVPLDPWKREYKYLNPGLHGEIDVFSFGRDGQSGGEGYDADIGNWTI
jgi:general secretion pathway protein G